MDVLRSIGSVIVGYLLFAVSAVGFFHLAGQHPHQDAPLSIMLASIAVGIIAAALGGYVAGLLAGRRPVAHGIAVASILALGACVSLASTFGHGAIWSQTAALILMAPSAVLGGWFRERQCNRARCG